MRKRFAPVNRAQYPGDDGLPLAVEFLFAQRLQRFDQIEADLKERQQLDGEQHCSELCAPWPHGTLREAGTSYREYSQSLVPRGIPGCRFIRRLELERHHFLPGCHRFQNEAHG